MKVVIQRVDKASVSVKDEVVSQINEGLMILVGFTHNDDINTIKYIANKIINLRIFDDDKSVMNLSVLDIKGELLSVSQFTLYGDATNGNRPSYTSAMKQDQANVLYELFNEELRKSKLKVETGIFREDMLVSLINHGPTTIIIEK